MTRQQKSDPAKRELFYLDETDGYFKPLASSDGTIPVNIKNTGVALPVDIQFANLKVSKSTLVNAVSIRNTTANMLMVNQDWSMYEKVTLRVTNTHNQPVKLTINLQDGGVLLKSDGTPMEFSVPASTTNMLLTASALPILGESLGEEISVNFTSATAPTSGNITVVANFKPLT